MQRRVSTVPVPTQPSETVGATLGFVASTGRTATMFLAATLDSLAGVTAFHEGHAPGESPVPRLPSINVQNRQAWHDPAVARRTVAQRRDRETLLAAADGADLVVDVAFYNAPLLPAVIDQHPTAVVLAIFRRCESFVRSATRMFGEDRQPAGWPDPAKELTDRERFIELGRLRPEVGTADADAWPQWSGTQRNIWLWHAVNSHLLTISDDASRAVALYYEDLVDEPRRFWATCLAGLGHDRPGDLDRCVASSGTPMNARPGYHVGPVTSWTRAERDMYDHLARPLEARIHGRR